MIFHPLHIPRAGHAWRMARPALWTASRCDGPHPPSTHPIHALPLTPQNLTYTPRLPCLTHWEAAPWTATWTLTRQWCWVGRCSQQTSAHPSACASALFANAVLHTWCWFACAAGGIGNGRCRVDASKHIDGPAILRRVGARAASRTATVLWVHWLCCLQHCVDVWQPVA